MRKLMIAVCVCSIPSFAACQKKSAPEPTPTPTAAPAPRLPAIKLTEAQVKAAQEATAGQHFRAFNAAAERLLEAKTEPEKMGPALEQVRTDLATLKQFAAGNSNVAGGFKAYIEQAEKFEAQAIVVADEMKASSSRRASPRNSSMLQSRYNSLVQLGGILTQLEANGKLK